MAPLPPSLSLRSLFFFFLLSLSSLSLSLFFFLSLSLCSLSLFRFRSHPPQDVIIYYMTSHDHFGFRNFQGFPFSVLFLQSEPLLVEVSSKTVTGRSATFPEMSLTFSNTFSRGSRKKRREEEKERRRKRETERKKKSVSQQERRRRRA